MKLIINFIYKYIYMNKLNNLPHILWINLDISKDRYDYIIEHFKYFNITNHTRIKAISHLEITNSYKILKKPFATTQSHLKALKYFLNNFNDEYIIIAEDDLSFQYIKYWEYDFWTYINKIPDDWEIIKLFTHYELFEQTPDKIDIINIKDRISYGNGCNLYKRSSVEKILKFYECNYNDLSCNELVCDRQFFKLCNTYAIPLMTFRDNNNSTILNNIFVEKTEKVKNKITELWENKKINII